MTPTYLDVHPVYGSIYQDGEFVQRGAVLGLSVNTKEVVVAPVSGWVRIVKPAEAPSGDFSGLRVEIWQKVSDTAPASPALDTAH